MHEVFAKNVCILPRKISVYAASIFTRTNLDLYVYELSTRDDREEKLLVLYEYVKVAF